MNVSSVDWQDNFARLFKVSTAKYQQGHQKAAGLVEPSDASFLESIGYTEQEFYDFVEDFSRGGEPTVDTAMAIAAVRRDYFTEEQKGRRTGHTISVEALPSKDATLDGIGWLPRLIPKAVAKLKGEMPPELMYGCGGDRKFFRAHQIDPAAFLRFVWKTDADEAKIADWVKTKGAS